MPLFPGQSNHSYKGRTHTNLVVSEGAAPAQEFKVSKDEAVKFQYGFGPEGNQNVVLAKGKIVESAPAEHDYDRGYKVTAIKQAAEGSKKAIGVNLKNVYQQKRGQFTGGNPTVLTRNYIEVPLFEHEVGTTAADFASAMNYGAAYGTNDGAQLQPGDYVKVGQDGNFTKLDTATDSPFEIIGQVWDVTRELPPAGFLQYYMEMDVPELEAYLKNASHAPSPGSADQGAGAFPIGYPYGSKGWQSEFEKLLNPTVNKGIPFLTDGYFRAKQSLTAIALNDIYDATTNNDGVVENVAFSGKVTFGHDETDTFTPSADNAVDAGFQVAPETNNNALFIKLRHAIDKGVAEPVVVKKDGAAVSSEDVHVDYSSNTVVVYLEAGETVNALTLDANLVVDPVAGVPTEWDYAGSVGAARILIQR